MPIYARKKDSNYTPAPEGLWLAVCVDVIDLGIVPTPWGEAPQIKIVWQLEEKDPKTDKRFIVSRKFTPSLHEKAHLRQMLESWRGRKFTKDEEKEFDIENLLGVNCQLQIIHNVKAEGETFANVQAVVGPPKGSIKLRAENFTRQVDREKQYEQHPDGKEPGDDGPPF
jgi:hypothetical protein